MRIVRYLLVAIVVLLPAIAIAQDTKPKKTSPIPVEVFFGNNRLVTQITVNRKFNESSKFGVLASSYTASDYGNKLRENESMNVLLLTYDVYKGLGLISGAALNSTWGFRPFAGGQYGYGNKLFSANISSGFYLTESNNFESLATIQFRPHIKDDWSLYTRIQGMYNEDMDTNKHDRAAIYGRLGLGYRAFGFGLASNLDWYGPNKVFVENYGVYLSYAF